MVTHASWMEIPEGQTPAKGDLLVHSTECPFCGRTFERIEEAIQKEREIWRPTEFGPDSWTDLADTTTHIDSNEYYPHFMGSQSQQGHAKGQKSI